MAAIGLLRSGHAPDHDAQNATPTAGARFQITLELGIRQRKKAWAGGHETEHRL